MIDKLSNSNLKKYEIVKVMVTDIKTDPANPNVLSKESETALSKSIDTFGYVQPIIVDKETMIIADGEHRLKTLKEKGITEVEVYLYPFKDDTERRLFRQISNKLHGTHNFDLDLKEFQVILEERGSLKEIQEYLALDDLEINRILEALKEPEEEKEEPVPKPILTATLKFKTKEDLEQAIDNLEAIKLRFKANLQIKL